MAISWVQAVPAVADVLIFGWRFARLKESCGKYLFVVVGYFGVIYFENCSSCRDL